MTRPLDKWNSADIAQHARRAEHLTPEDIPMRMTVVEYSWQHPPRKPRIVGPTGTRIVLALPVVAIVAALVVAGANW